MKRGSLGKSLLFGLDFDTFVGSLLQLLVEMVTENFQFESLVFNPTIPELDWLFVFVFFFVNVQFQACLGSRPVPGHLNRDRIEYAILPEDF